MNLHGISLDDEKFVQQTSPNIEDCLGRKERDLVPIVGTQEVMVPIQTLDIFHILLTQLKRIHVNVLYI